MHLRLFLLRVQQLVAWCTVSVVASFGHGQSPASGILPFQVIHSSKNELVLLFRIPAYTLDTIYTLEGIQTVRVRSMYGYPEVASVPGAPGVGRLSTMIAIPSPDASVKLEVKGISERWIDVPIAPSLRTVPTDGDERGAYSIDPKLYQTHQPADVQCSYAGISRGVPLAYVSIPVVEYLPTQNQTRIIEQCTVHITFSPVEPAITGDASLPVINQMQLRQWMQQGKRQRLQRRQTPLVFDASTPAVKVSTDQEGVYAITAEDLARVGVQVPRELVHTIKLYGYGGQPRSEMPSDGKSNTPIEQPIIVEVNYDGSLRAVVFYAAPPRGFAFDSVMKRWRRYQNPYTTKTSYILTWGGTPGLRATPVTSPLGEPTLVPQYFYQRVLLETDRINAYNSPSGLRWFGDPFDGTTGTTITTPLPSLALNADAVEYTVCVAHKSDNPATISVSEHGVEVKQIPLAAKMKLYSEYVSVVDTVRVPIDRVATDRRAVLRLRYLSANSTAIGYLDYIEIAYPSLLVASDDELHVYTEPTDVGLAEFSVSGFSGQPLCFDITDPARPQLCSNRSIAGQHATIRTLLDTLSQAQRPRQFFFSAKRRKPELAKIEFGSARDTSIDAEMIVITPSAFIESATAYATYRKQLSGIDVVVMPVEQIYAAFSAGMPDPTAIRDFISFAYFNWKKRPRYVLLWGDGHYDYRGLTTTTPNWIPPYENDNNVEQQFGRSYDWSYADDSYATEDYFGCVEGDDNIMDIALGRLTITSDQMGRSMLNKIQHYEQSSALDSWAITATLVADDGPTSNGRSDGALHVNSSERISRKIESVLPGIIQRKIYMPEYPLQFGSSGNRKPGATEAMLSIVNGQGTLLLQWIGHGNPRVWAHEEIFDRDKTIALMRNQSKLFFLVAATCDFARFDMTDSQSGAEKLLEWEYGGAIGVFSATRVVYTIANEWISLRFYEELAKRTATGRRRTLGDVLLGIKLTEYGSNDRRYFLLGDPAMRLTLPELAVQIDSVQDQPVSDSVQTVCAMQTISVRGSIYDPVTNQPVDNFDGTAIVSMFDADGQLQIQDPAERALGYSTTYQFWKTGGMLHRGAYSVKKGTFSASFTIPKDATISDNPSRLYVYAIDTLNKASGAGIHRRLNIGCVETASVEDRQGPSIAMFLDSRNFRSGDLVRSNPELIVDLADETGINSTGIGIGHKIEAWVDDNFDPVDLTEYYEPSLEDPRRGTAKRQLFGLTPGYHRITVRAWDVLNNFSIAQVGFVVASSDSLFELGRVEIYPQPFSDKVVILYNHNQYSPMTITMTITQLDGRQVYVQSSLGADVHSTRFEWDGRSSDGMTLPAGIYPVVITAENSFGSRMTVRRLLVKIQ